MGQHLTEGKYSTMEEFAKDVELVFSNCRQFNPPTTYPVNCADVVEKVFKREWTKSVEKKLSWAEKRSLQGLMTSLVKDDMSVYPEYFSCTLLIVLFPVRSFSESL